MALIMLVRHGRTSGNSSGRFVGQYDEGLDEAGRQQALLLVPRLMGFGPDRVISSDLGRCTQTMEPFAAAAGMQIKTDPRLREVGDGEWTNRTQQELWQGWPDLMRRYSQGEDVPRPGGERWGDVRGRVMASLSQIISEMGSEQKVIVCTHAGPILMISSWVVRIDLPGNIFLGPIQPPGNAAVTLFDPHRPTLVSYNETCHLSPGYRVLDQQSGVTPIR